MNWSTSDIAIYQQLTELTETEEVERTEQEATITAVSVFVRAVFRGLESCSRASP
jgi:hypothetical protein